MLISILDGITDVLDPVGSMVELNLFVVGSNVGNEAKETVNSLLRPWPLSHCWIECLRLLLWLWPNHVRLCNTLHQTSHELLHLLLFGRARLRCCASLRFISH